MSITDEQLSSICSTRDREALLLLGGAGAVLKLVGVDAGTGLHPDDVAARRERFGANTFPEKPARSFLAYMWDAAQDMTLLILIVAAGLSLLAGLLKDKEEGWHDGVAILFAITVCITVSAYNDYTQGLQFRALNADKRNIPINVLRGSRRLKVSVYDLVVGDIVVLATGDQIPADGLLLSGQSVVVDESAMTGESDPLRKDAETKPFMLSGCKVNEGYGEMVVTAVGLNTEWGRIMAVTSEENDEETPLQVRLDSVATSIGKVGTLVAFIVFVVLFVRDAVSGSGAWYNHLINAFIVGVTIIVVAVPEGLPLAVTLSLAYSMKKMMRIDNALVRHLSACEGMGGATTICSDKTGTLTTNKMTVVSSWVAGQESDPARPAGCDDVPAAALELLVQSCFLNTTGAVAPPPDGSPPGAPLDIAGSPTEQALLRFASGLPGASFPRLRASMPLLHMEPFSSARKTMGVAAAQPGSGVTRVFWKGASEIVLAACTTALTPAGDAAPLTPSDRVAMEARIEAYAARALRTIVLAYSELPASAVLDPEAALPWGDLTLVALVGIKDPCRPGVPEAVSACQQAGIIVRMVTGDNVSTARAIATECGIFDVALVHLAMEGPAFRALPRAEALLLLPRLRVLARSSPTDKHTLVSLLRSTGEVVAVTGDGTNDAPALHEADIGLAMGIAGTEVAKEAADIIIMDDNFATCVKVVRWGRATYRNIQSFVQFQLTVNVVALVLNMVCALAGGDIPLTAVQLLWVNMIMDTLGALALATEPPRDSLMLRKPYGRTEPIINNVMWRNLLLMALYQLIVLFVLYWGGCSILNFGSSKQIVAPPGDNRCHDYPTTPYVGVGYPNGTKVCYDRERGCPPSHDINGAHFAMDDRLAFLDYNTLLTMIFNAFVFMQLTNELNARRMEDKNIFEDLLTNHIFMAVLLFTTIAQVLIVEFAGTFAQTVSLSWQHWFVCVVIGVVAWPIAFLVKLIKVPESPTLPEYLTPTWYAALCRSKVADEEAATEPLSTAGEVATGGENISPEEKVD
jgi:Ca2+-transporting ATPase